MSDVQQLGQAGYTAGSGQWTGDDLNAAASQLSAGDTAMLKITFPVPINFIPGDFLATALSPLFAAVGQTLQGVDFEGDSTLVLQWTVG